MVTAKISTRRGHLRVALNRRTAPIDHGRKLKAETLSERRGGLDEDIVASQGFDYDLSLEGSEAF